MKSVYDRLHVHLLKQEVIHADETTAQVLHEDGKTPRIKSHIYGFIRVGHLKNTEL